METNELELLKKVLPLGFTVEVLTTTRPRWEVRDEDGEVLVQGTGTTAREAVVELMEQSRRNGLHEGRSAKQREVLTALGVTEVVKALREEMLDRTEKQPR